MDSTKNRQKGYEIMVQKGKSVKKYRFWLIFERPLVRENYPILIDNLINFKEDDCNIDN